MTSHERGRTTQLPVSAASCEYVRACVDAMCESLCVERSLYTRNILHSHDVTSLKAHYVSITKTSRLTLFREIIAVCSENNTKLINALSGRYLVFLLVTASSTYIHHD
jgi:hypothetical protein